jgi:hypothetical protein
VGLAITAAETPMAHWRILGAHHGDEASSAEVVLFAMRQLLEGYGVDEDLTQVLDRDAVWFVPHVNPDGVDSDSRYNANSVDLNRNYDYEWSSDEFRSGDFPFSEPETRAVRVLSSWVPFHMGLSVHSGAANIGWIWNYTTSPTPDESLVSAMAELYADACSVSDFWTTNGASWYITNGDTNDWSYGRQGTLDFTLEVSETKEPPEAELDALVEAHWTAIRAFLLWSDVVVGQVTDASGRGIRAMVQVDDGWSLTTGPEGHFARAFQGTPDLLQVSAPGYQDAAVAVPSSRDLLYVALEPSHLSSAQPEPRSLSNTGDGRFTLDMDASSVLLTHPFEDDVEASWNGSSWEVDPSAMIPGLWNLWLDEAVVPRGLFIGESDDAVEVTDVLYEDGVLTLSGAGFGTGTRAWSLSGTDRAPTPLEIVAESESELTLQLDSSAHSSETLVDVWLVSRGRQLTVSDVLGEASIDTAAPHDTGSVADTADLDTASGLDIQDTAVDAEQVRGLSSCGCNGAGFPLSPAWAVTLGVLFRRRRTA